MIAGDVIVAVYYDSNYVSASSVVSTWNEEMYVGCSGFDLKGIRIFLC